MVKQKKSGLYIREDVNLGTLIYSPFTSQLSSSLENESFKAKLISWLDGKEDVLVEKEYLKSLGPGWKFPVKEAEPQSNKYLSSTNKKVIIHKSEYPLVVNWLITSLCLGKCGYCYAKDIMNGNFKEPSDEIVKSVANTILDYRPLAVVLSGGDPLCSNNLENALSHLHKKTGLILDTNGFGLNDYHIKLFKKYDVFVRISLDSQNPKDNNRLRASKDGACSLQAAIDAINKCLQNNIPVGIQTVVTSRNLGGIISLSDKLPRLGIRGWRLQLLAYHELAVNYKQLKPNVDRFYKNIAPQVAGKAGKKNMGMVYVDVVHNNFANSVVLVLPDGGFYTELKGVGKVPIDPNNIKKPSIEVMRDGVLHREGHTARYLGDNWL